MILFTGPLYSGKRRCAEQYLTQRGEDPSRCRILADAQDAAVDCASPEDLQKTADLLAHEYDIILFTETGSGLVPLEAEERRVRESAGRLAVLLAQQADEVYRVVCGLSTQLK